MGEEAITLICMMMIMMISEESERRSKKERKQPIRTTTDGCSSSLRKETPVRLPQKMMCVYLLQE